MGNCHCKDMEAHDRLQRETEIYANKRVPFMT